MSAQVSFEATSEERGLARQIARRARRLEQLHTPHDVRDLLDIEMDIVATHANGNALRFADLLAADDFNFAHDVFGIAHHLDRNTGKLTGCFRPRYSRPDPHPFDDAIPMGAQHTPGAKFVVGDLLRARTSEYPAGYVRSVSSDRKGVWYIVGFGRGRSKREQMLREEAAVLVRSNAETDAMLADHRAAIAKARGQA